MQYVSEESAWDQRRKSINPCLTTGHLLALWHSEKNCSKVFSPLLKASRYMLTCFGEVMDFSMANNHIWLMTSKFIKPNSVLSFPLEGAPFQAFSDPYRAEAAVLGVSGTGNFHDCGRPTGSSVPDIDEVQFTSLLLLTSNPFPHNTSSKSSPPSRAGMLSHSL